jgi:hypothetical protein
MKLMTFRRSVSEKLAYRAARLSSLSSGFQHVACRQAFGLAGRQVRWQALAPTHPRGAYADINISYISHIPGLSALFAREGQFYRRTLAANGGDASRGRKRPFADRHRRRNTRRPRSGQPHDSERGQQFEQHRSIWRPCADNACAYGPVRRPPLAALLMGSGSTRSNRRDPMRRGSGGVRSIAGPMTENSSMLAAWALECGSGFSPIFGAASTRWRGDRL